VVQGSTANTPPVFKDGNSTEIGTLCRAWVNFNGTGTVAIRASFNVSSITDNGTGDYTVNFTNAMPDANYSVVASCDTYLASNTPTVLNTFNGGTYSTSAVRVITTYSFTTNFQDVPKANISVFR
jgi:hypothetical protein